MFDDDERWKRLCSGRGGDASDGTSIDILQLVSLIYMLSIAELAVIGV